MAKKKEDATEEGQMADIPVSAIRGARCVSCGVSIVNDIGAVKFPCPNCGKTTIIRCSKCRKIVTKYKCHECGFEGPN
jgi:predicted RNA-binding Zn-ribbon protein involved in translation (DUF1610 family)